MSVYRVPKIGDVTSKVYIVSFDLSYVEQLMTIISARDIYSFSLLMNCLILVLSDGR
jgi:hypothetical protein